MVTMVTSYCNYLVELGVTAEKLKSIGHHTMVCREQGWVAAAFARSDGFLSSRQHERAVPLLDQGGARLWGLAI